MSLTDPTQWPLGDILTLTRPDPQKSLWPECGVLTARQPLVVYLTDAFTPGLSARLRACEKIYYQSEEQLERDGWRVD